MKKLSYSEAIRLGSLLTPQGFGWSRASTTACANDAASLAAGLGSKFGYSLFDYFPLANLEAECPACAIEFVVPDLAGIVCHLNDEHRWTRERIADFVESIERETEHRLDTEESDLHKEQTGVSALPRVLKVTSAT